ncbi:hypothetical protein [Sulfobacillus thermosulfidooxidans]|uniref:hypothetical protein n=1 Tax=Sulfobacillus thermosulfidooxidans TaxID=28034 RepID=UPI00040B950F|nr:hypothetical protein [Sulfobacillus thermosulfidooxidans]
MATSELSRRARHNKSEPPFTTDPVSRADLKRMVQQRRMEREFAWACSITLTSTTLYLIWRLPWGQQVLISVLHFVKTLHRI